jgi:hypothetical protein
MHEFDILSSISVSVAVSAKQALVGILLVSKVPTRNHHRTEYRNIADEQD